MTWLNAALAFAITFLILSMVSSVFVETIHRILGMREKKLKLLLGQYFDRVLTPYLQGSGADVTSHKKPFLDLMTLNRAPAGAAGGTNIGESETWRVSEDDSHSMDGGLASRLWSGRRLARLTREQFMSRLGDSDVGSAINQAVTQSGAAEPDLALHDLADKFDAFAAEASEFFGRRARLFSILVSIGVAWFLYVHPFDIFKSYMQHPEVAEKVIEMQAQAEADFLAKNGEVLAADDASIDPAVKGARAKAAALQDAGVPIGWTEARLASSGFKVSTWGIPYPAESKGMRTLLWLVLGGLLIGLGGPFWYDAVKSLTNIRSIIGGGSSETTEAKSEGPAGEKKPTQAAVDLFKQSQTGKSVANNVPSVDDDVVG